MMAVQRARRSYRFTVLVTAAVLVGLSVVFFDIDTVQQPLYTIPLSCDRFLNAVRAITPAHARLLLLDPLSDPQHHFFLRALYVLYPRTLILETGDRLTSAGVVPPVRWDRLHAIAHHRRATAIIVWARPLSSSVLLDPWQWSLPAPPQGAVPPRAVMVRSGWGTLVGAAR